MKIESWASWRQTLASGDAELKQGHVGVARETYGELLGVLKKTEGGRAPKPYVLTAVVTHRVAVAEFLGGNSATAEKLISDVNHTLDLASANASSPRARGYVEVVREQSEAQFRELRATGHGRVLAAMAAICTHRCPSITMSCGFSYQHC
jgi:hypothetical protein